MNELFGGVCSCAGSSMIGSSGKVIAKAAYLVSSIRGCLTDCFGCDGGAS